MSDTRLSRWRFAPTIYGGGPLRSQREGKDRKPWFANTQHPILHEFTREVLHPRTKHRRSQFAGLGGRARPENSFIRTARRSARKPRATTFALLLNV